MHQLLKIFTIQPVYADSNWNTNCVSNGTSTLKGFECIYKNIADIVVYFAGLVFLVMLIRGGFSYLTAGGDPKKVAKANHSLSVSVIGLVGTILSYLILKLVVTLTGIEVTQFNIPN